jgi:hypothetical protein
MPDDFESKFSNASSGKIIRTVIANKKNKESPNATKQAWRDLFADPRQRVMERFEKMNYTNEKAVVIQPASNEEIAAAWAFLQAKVDPTIDAVRSKTKKHVLKNNPSLVNFLQMHINSERYHLEFRKCGSVECSTCTKVS